MVGFSDLSQLDKIGKRITELREKLGMSQTELADELKVSRALVSAWENGRRDIKTGDVIALAAALNTNCDFLLTGVSTQNIDFSKESGLSEATINRLCRYRMAFEKKYPELLAWSDTMINDLLAHSEYMMFVRLYSQYFEILQKEFQSLRKQSDVQQNEYFKERKYSADNDIINNVKMKRFRLLECIARTLDDDLLLRRALKLSQTDEQ